MHQPGCRKWAYSTTAVLQAVRRTNSPISSLSRLLVLSLSKALLGPCHIDSSDDLLYQLEHMLIGPAMFVDHLYTLSGVGIHIAVLAVTYAMPR